MKSKFQLILLNLAITVISIYFTYAIYIEYKQTQQEKVQNYIQSSLESNKSVIKNSFKKIKKEIEKDRILFYEIHKRYTKSLRENPNQDIRKLKNEILNEYELSNKDIHLFLLNKDYTITDATYKKDIGFKLGLVPDARIELDRSKDGDIYQSKSVSIDIITSDVKSYSYSKINDELYFEMGFINYEIHDILKVSMSKIRMLTNERSNLYRIEQKLDNTEYYDNVLYKKTDKTKEEYLRSRKKYDKSKDTSNLIIKANRTGEIYKEFKDKDLVFYIPLIKKKNDYLELMGDFVLELHIDRTNEIEVSKKIELYYYIFLFFHILFLLIIYYFTKKYHESQIKLQYEHNQTKKLFEENSSFVESMTNQIKTPLSVIMSNYIFIENASSSNHKKFLQQIKSSINMLKTSYEDLSYLVENKKHTYVSKKIDLVSFLEERVTFFNDIAKTQNKSLVMDIKKGIYIKINEIELERLIDNNISNAIKYAQQNKAITIKVEYTKSSVFLKFYSYGEEITNKDRIFERNYQERLNSNQSLGLGLSMVKSICLKYDILYKVEFEDEQNIFIYEMKRTK